MDAKFTVANTNGKYFDTRTYVNCHPENANGSIIPFLYNDLAFLTLKGGALSSYQTTATTFTASTLASTAINQTNIPNMFDGTPSYSFISTTGEFTTVFDLTLHKTFTYSNVFYIDFGSTSWRAKNIKILVMNSATETAYVQKASVTNHPLACYYAGISHSSTNSSGTTVQGFNKLRIVLSG